MYFRNLTLFRFRSGIEARFDGLHEALLEHALRPCGPLELESRGFVSPYGAGDNAMDIRIGACVLLCLGGETKILPSAVINQHVAEKLADLELERGRPVGARERRKLKDDAMTELLPQALCKPWRLAGYVDLRRGWVVVDTASRKAAEGFVNAIRDAVGSFPAVNLETEESPRALMTYWMVNNQLPDGFSLGDECELKDPADKGAIVRCRRQDLTAEEMREHLACGKQVTQLSLVFEDRMRFVLDEALCVRKFKLLDIATEALEQGDRDSAKAELDARFALMTGEIGRLLDYLQGVFEIGRPEGAP